MRDSFLKSLFKLAEEDSRVMLLTADLGFGVFETFQEMFPKQFINVGVAEQNMTGIATGLALEGRIVFTYSIANFPTLRCLEQIRNDAAYHEANINIVASGGGFSYGALGMSHHATEDLSIMRSLPGVTVFAPCDRWEVEQGTIALAKTKGVGYLRIDKTAASDNCKDSEIFSLGKARRLREGTDISLICSGGITAEALAAAEVLSKNSIECRVISMHTLKPLDVNEVIRSIEDTGGIVTIEENNINGGLGGAVSEACLEYSRRPDKFLRIGIKDTYSAVVGSQAYLRKYYGIDKDTIVETILSMFNTTSR